MIPNINYILSVIVLCLGLVAIFMAYKALDFKEAKETGNPNIMHEVIGKSDAIVEKKYFGSWLYECSINNAGIKLCSAHQEILGSDNNQILDVEIFLIERGGSTLPRMKIIVPLGTFIPLGISISFADQEPFILPYQFCFQYGCFINLDLAQDVVDALKKNEKLDITYQKANRDNKKLSLSLLSLSVLLKKLHGDYHKETP